MQIVCDSQAAFDSEKGMLAFVYNIYIQACATNVLNWYVLIENTSLDFFHPLESYESGFYFKEKDFKVKWIAQIVQLFYN